jgi:threonine/homoserine/homoserine lactone efflux protein
MLELLTSPNIASFILASIVIILAPGPDSLFLINQAIQNGRLCAILTAWGLSLGNLFHTALASLGISAVILASPPLFNGIRLMGVCYLLFFAYKTLTDKHFSENNGSENNSSENNLSANDIAINESSKNILIRITPSQSHYRAKAFYKGLLMNILNIKVTVFFIAYLPQFVAVSDVYNSSVSEQIFVLGLCFTFCVSIIFTAIAVLAGSLNNYINFNARYSYLLKIGFASIYVFIALKLWI